MSKNTESQSETLVRQTIDDQSMEIIRTALESLQFGAVEITVHNGRIVQLDRRERIRFLR